MIGLEHMPKLEDVPLKRAVELWLPIHPFMFFSE